MSCGTNPTGPQRSAGAGGREESWSVPAHLPIKLLAVCSRDLRLGLVERTEFCRAGPTDSSSPATTASHGTFMSNRRQARQALADRLQGHELNRIASPSRWRVLASTERQRPGRTGVIFLRSPELASATAERCVTSKLP